jgi:hypothetical protein
MKRNFVKILTFCCCAISLILNSCNQTEEETVYNNPELLFSNSLTINVNPYTYTEDESGTFQVLGDSALVADTVSSTPELKWDNIWTGLITVAISKTEFIVSDDKIINAEDIIWQWQPGMESGEFGNVAYLEGKEVNNKNILYSTQPLPLENGLYYWAVWGWDKSGRTILYSSKPQKIYVK